MSTFKNADSALQKNAQIGSDPDPTDRIRTSLVISALLTTFKHKFNTKIDLCVTFLNLLCEKTIKRI